MYEIPVDRPGDEFVRCFRAAVRHIKRQVQGPLRSWLKVVLVPPFLEHLSFRLGNQLFFIRLEDCSGELDTPGTPAGLLRIADGCGGHPCVMPMREVRGAWRAEAAGWGLVHARTGEPVVPPALITDELIEMSDWELHGFAVQVVRDRLEAEGRQVTGWSDDPAIAPSVWFHDRDSLEWVVVRGVRYPVLEAAPPDNWAAIAQSCRRSGTCGYFASVSFANCDDPFLPGGEGALPLWRGHPATVRYEGLVRIEGLA